MNFNFLTEVGFICCHLLKLYFFQIVEQTLIYAFYVDFVNSVVVYFFIYSYIYIQLMLNFYKDRNIRVVMIRPDHPLAVKHLAPDSKSGFMIFKRGELPPLWTHS